MASAFRVDYTPEKSGIYEISVFCGNILLNGGHGFRKEVKAGKYEVTYCLCVCFLESFFIHYP